MGRYSEPTQEVWDIIGKIIDDHFPYLANCHIMVLMDSKKRKSREKYIFASIKQLNEKERYLSADNYVTEGYDFLLTIDENVFDNIVVDDKIRLLRHELRHISYDPDNKKPFKVRDHDFCDFKEEIELNKDDPMWGEKLSEIAESIYEKDKKK